MSVLVFVFATAPRWHQAIPPGTGCLPPRCTVGQLPLALPSVAHGGWLFMIGDGADPKRIYESADGIHWLAYEHDAEWGMRYRAADASFRGAPWRVSGFVQAADRHVLVSDVWRSVDGRRWTRLLTRAPWSPRHGAHLVVLRDSLWLVGGEPNDRLLWFTTDGHAWGSRPATGLPASDPQAVIAHRGLLWILGHGVWETATNDVWSSPDDVMRRLEAFTAVQDTVRPVARWSGGCGNPPRLPGVSVAEPPCSLLPAPSPLLDFVSHAGHRDQEDR